MGDGIVRKYAIIINEDVEQRHLDNVSRAAKVLKSGGYALHVASPEKPKVAVANHVKPTLAKVQKLIAGVKATIDDDDMLVIYNTGHGGNGEEICLSGGSCVRNPIVAQLDKLPHARRVFVIDSCFGGNLSTFFTDDPKTLFVAAGVKGKQVCCGKFAPMFWKGAAILKKLGWDLNKDGLISWQERYAAAYKGHRAEARLFLHSKGFRDHDVESGKVAKPPFPARLVNVATNAALKARIKGLKPGQYAIVGFGMKGCLGCDVYKPQFQAMAKAAGGQHLFLWTKSSALRTRYGVSTVPRVIVFDGFGNRYTVDDRQRVLEIVAGQNMPVVTSAYAYFRGYLGRKVKRNAKTLAWALERISRYSDRLTTKQRAYVKRRIGRFLRSRDVVVSVSALRLFVTLRGIKALPRLIALLKHRHHLVRRAAVDTIRDLVRDELLTRDEDSFDWKSVNRIRDVATRSLKDRDVDVRQTSAFILMLLAAGIEDIGEGAIKALTAAMHDRTEDDYVRIYAARALKEALEEDIVPVFTKILTNPKAYTIALRVVAVMTLGKHGGKRVVAALKTALVRDPDWRIRHYAGGELKEIMGRAMAPDFIAALGREKTSRVRRGLMEVLGLWHEARAIPAIAKVLAQAKGKEYRMALTALSRMKDRSIIPIFIAELNRMKPGNDLRVTVIRWLGRRADRRAITPILKLLGDRDETVGHEAAYALGRLTTPWLTYRMINTLLGRGPSLMRRRAAQLLGYMKHRDDDVIVALASAHDDRDELVRATAAFASLNYGDLRGRKVLYRLRRAGKVDTFIAALGVQDWRTRNRAALILGEMLNVRAVPRLIVVAGDERENRVVRKTAIEALGRIGGKRAAAALGKLGTGSDMELRYAAKDALERAQVPLRVWKMPDIPSLVRTLTGGTVPQRAKAAYYLGRAPRSAIVISALRSALRDSSDIVREIAKMSLQNFGAL